MFDTKVLYQYIYVESLFSKCFSKCVNQIVGKGIRCSKISLHGFLYDGSLSVYYSLNIDYDFVDYGK